MALSRETGKSIVLRLAMEKIDQGAMPLTASSAVQADNRTMVSIRVAGRIPLPKTIVGVS
jgi:hypothetical protein